MPLLKTRSDAVRRAVMRFLKDLAGPQLAPFLQEVASRGDDFARLAALELARELPAADGVRHRAARPDRLEPGRARAGPEGRQRDDVRGERGRRGEPRRAAPSGRERGDPLLRARRPREEPERELLPRRPPDGADGRRPRHGGVVRGPQEAPRDGQAGPHARDRPAPRGRERAREGRHRQPAPPLRAGRPRAADPRALPRLVRLGARPRRRDGARRPAGLRERAPQAHARSGHRSREGGLRDDARARGRQGAAGLDLARRRQGHLGQDARARDARTPRQGRGRRPRARPRRPEGARARHPGRLGPRRPRATRARRSRSSTRSRPP